MIRCILSEQFQNADLDSDGILTILDVQAFLREYLVPSTGTEPDDPPAVTTVFTQTTDPPSR